MRTIKDQPKKRWRDLCPWVARSALDEAEGRLARMADEYANYRRRTQAERQIIGIRERAGTVQPFLAVYDDLQRALMQDCADDAFFAGVRLTLNKLESVLDSLGVKEIEALGKPFDPVFHHAVERAESPDADEDTVVEVLQRGFMLNDQVIRFAMVKVAIRNETQDTQKEQP